MSRLTCRAFRLIIGRGSKDVSDRLDITDLLNQGITAAKAGRNEQARRLLRQAIEQDEDNEQAWLWLSSVVESPDEQRLCLENVVAINPSNAFARAGLRRLAGTITPPAGKTEDSGQRPIPPAPQAPPLPEERAVVPAPPPSVATGEGAANDAAILVEKARLYLTRMQNVPHAIVLLRRAVEIQPENGQAYLLLGDAYLQLDDVAQAARYFSRASRHTVPASQPGREARLKLKVLQESARSMVVPVAAEYAGTVSVADMRRSLEARRTYGYAGRPGCVTLYASFAAVSGLLALVGTGVVGCAGSSLISFLQEKSNLIALFLQLLISQDLVRTATWIVAGVSLLAAVINLVIATGLWQMKNWARIGVVMTNALGLLSIVCPCVLVWVFVSKVFTGPLLTGIPTSLLVIPVAGLGLMGAAAYWFAAHGELFE